MANMFVLTLVIATIITGGFWCFEHFKWASSNFKKILSKNSQTVLCPLKNKKLVNIAKYPQSWIKSAASLFPVLLLVFIVRSFIYEPFRIPSASMMPTLLIGDFILVEKYAYGIKNPITHSTIIETGHPKRGDIAVFKYPLQPKLDYIKSVIGLPGDRITYDVVNKHLTIYPNCNNAKFCSKTLPVIYNDVHPSDFVQLFTLSGSNNLSHEFYRMPLRTNVPQNGLRLKEVHETLGEVTHAILIVPGTQDMLAAYYQQMDNPLAEWLVPAGYYFMMGDNRDNSADSRYWGFVPEKNLVGKARAIWMSFEKQEGKWPTGVRVSRIGAIY